MMYLTALKWLTVTSLRGQKRLHNQIISMTYEGLRTRTAHRFVKSFPANYMRDLVVT